MAARRVVDETALGECLIALLIRLLLEGVGGCDAEIADALERVLSAAKVTDAASSFLVDVCGVSSTPLTLFDLCRSSVVSVMLRFLFCCLPWS